MRRFIYNRIFRYTEIDIRVLFTLDGNDKGLHGHSKKICKPTFNTDITKYFFLKYESLTDGTLRAPVQAAATWQL